MWVLPYGLVTENNRTEKYDDLIVSKELILPLLIWVDCILEQCFS